MGGKSQSRKGKVRKSNDRVDLKPRSSGAHASGSGGASGGTTKQECLTSFEVPLPGAKDTPVGSRLSLQQENANWLVMANGRPIGTIGSGRSDMLTRCLGIGYRYRGELTTRADRKYGAFQRTA
jgi:hypothetical protein